MRQRTNALVLAACLAATAVPAAAQPNPSMQARLDTKIAAVRAWAAEPAVVAAVKAGNAASARHAAMTQESWSKLSVLDPVVRAFTTNDAAKVLKSKRTDEISEAFVSSASGFKVAFLSKPSNWSHRGKPKHDVPMAGKAWRGEIETDASTGIQQIQVAVPVLDNGKPIGSLVVGFAVSKLR